MRKYDKELGDYLEECAPTMFTIMSVIRELIVAISLVHESGHVYNDIKMENVMIKKYKNPSTRFYIKLIDYGFVTKYTDDAGNHLKPGKVNFFKGNLLFSSVSTLNFNVPSRKDDLISLCYLMLYLFNGGKLPLFDTDH